VLREGARGRSVNIAAGMIGVSWGKVILRNPLRRGWIPMNKHSELTAGIAQSLKYDEFDVLYDHESEGEMVGKIVSTNKKEFFRDDEFSQLDIAVVHKGSKVAVALVEIEETNDRPKTILGGLFGVLYGKHILFKGTALKTGKFTTLIVVGVSKADHEKRNKYLLKRMKKVKAALDTKNSRIGKVVIKTYADVKDLSIEVPALLEKVVKGGV
jgi:hypothetical protein